MLAEFDFRILADVNASLNATAFVLIVAGLIAIKKGHETAHKRLMLTAAGVSALFLVSYVTYHTTCPPVKFAGEGAIKYVYLFILFTHIVLAVVNAPLVIATIVQGLKDNRARHRKLAKITAPIWIYVSITGVIVYVMLYHM
jgi:putative membrane protein